MRKGLAKNSQHTSLCIWDDLVKGRKKKNYGTNVDINYGYI